MHTAAHSCRLGLDLQRSWWDARPVPISASGADSPQRRVLMADLPPRSTGLNTGLVYALLLDVVLWALIVTLIVVAA